MTRLLPLALLAACASPNSKPSPGTPAPAALALSLDNPLDGAFVSDNLSVSGSSAGASLLTVGGQQLEPSEAWSTQALLADAPWPDTPLLPLLAHAEDADGAWLRQRVTALVGRGVRASDPVVDGLLLRLTDAALDTLRPELADQVASIDLASQLVTGAPVTTQLGSDVYVDAISYDTLALDDLDFTPAGLHWAASITNLSTDLRLDIIFLGESAGTITADRIDVTGNLVFGADNGALVANSGGTQVSFTNLDTSSFTGTSSGLVSAAVDWVLKIFLGQMFEDQVVSAVDDALALQDDLRLLDLGGVIIRSDFAQAAHDDNGVTISATSTVETADGPLEGLRLANPGPVPRLTSADFEGTPYGAALILNDDLLSTLGVGLAQGGMLDQELSGELGGLSLDTTLLAGFVDAFGQLPAGTPVTLRTRPTAPICASPGVDEAARFDIGGMALDFIVDDEEVMNVALDMVLGIGSDPDTLLALDLVDSRATVLATTLDVPDPTEVETPLGGLFNLVLPAVMGDALGTGLTPGSLQGVSIVGDGPIGDEGDYAAIYFDLAL